MGSTQATPQKDPNEPDLCWLCLSRFQRERQALCTCNHCSHPLCSECLNDHVNELPQNVAQLTEQLHDLEQLLQDKQTMVSDVLTQSTTDVKEYFKTYQSELLEANHAITVGLENEKQRAKKYLDQIHSELTTLSSDITTLAEERLSQPMRMEALLNQLNGIQERLQTYEVTKDVELPKVLPRYTLKFECGSVPAADAPETSTTETSLSQDIGKRRSNRPKKFHPYKNPPDKVLLSRNILPHNDANDDNE